MTSQAASYTTCVMVLRFLGTLILAILLSSSGVEASFGRRPIPMIEPPCDRPVFWFDLGQVLLDSSNWESQKLMPGALAYLTQVRERGHDIGLIVNIPEDWGKTEAEKLARMKGEIESHWNPSETERLPWGWFDWILVPPSDAFRKPHPFLFQRAREISGNCAMIFQGDAAAEVRTAESEGMRGYLVGQPGRPFYLPLLEKKTVQ